MAKHLGDEIQCEIFKLVGDPEVEALNSSFNVWYRTGSLPNDFKRSIFFFFTRVSEATKREDHQSISLIRQTLKYLLKNLIKSNPNNKTE